MRCVAIFLVVICAFVLQALAEVQCPASGASDQDNLDFCMEYPELIEKCELKSCEGFIKVVS
uniref:Small venom protein 1 n=1 Tax=Pimpla hypochondriaca TaxID=135724 RepID=SVP1_PIMHY|nr:RecName: Full=Small venom protein 1; Short=svp1; Flags: Precursor [Pimpla hypochondriaca]CAD30853.1 small venom protein 1 [Pimpla hypochondriaca]